MTSLSRLAVLILVLLGSSGLPAKETSVAILDSQSREHFDEQAAAVRVQMDPGGRRGFVRPQERSAIESLLVKRERLLAGVTDAKDMSDRQNADRMSAQEDIHAILTERGGRRLICELMFPVSTHRKIRRCATYAEREHLASQEYLRQADRKMITKNPVMCGAVPCLLSTI